MDWPGTDKATVADCIRQGHGIINADGELWRAQRKAGLSFLNTSNLRVLTDVALPALVARSVDVIRRADPTAPVDLQAVFHDITTRLMGRMAYNMEMRSGDEFDLAFEYASGATAERFQNPLWQLTDVFFGRRLRRAVATIRKFGNEIVASAVRDRENSKARAAGAGALSDRGNSKAPAAGASAVSDRENSKAPAVGAGESTPGSRLDEISGSLIQSLLDSIGDHEIVADAALNYLSAGRDTTAQALTWTFYLLFQNRYVMGRVRNEVKGVLAASGGWAASKGLDTTLFKPTSLPFTLAVFYESLRLFPPIPFEIKQCLRDTTLPDGTFLPRSSVVVWCPWAMNRSRITWGEDADMFRPDRWLSAGDDGTSPKVMNRSAAEFPVFNGGARLCLGKKMAELIAVQVIAAFAWEFDFVPAFEGERVSKSSLTLPMKDGLPCFARQRKNLSLRDFGDFNEAGDDA